jgi:hypothetical protein
MNRQELNMWFLQIDWSTSEVKKEIIVGEYTKNPHWKGSDSKVLYSRWTRWYILII